jgi:hypothetical protein
VTVDCKKVVSMRIAEQTTADNPGKAAAAAQEVFKKKTLDILKRTGLKNGKLRTLPKLQINQSDLQYGDIIQCIARTVTDRIFFVWMFYANRSCDHSAHQAVVVQHNHGTPAGLAGVPRVPK